MSIYLGRIKLSLSFSLPKIEKGKLDMQYGDVKIKHYWKVTYLCCELDESLRGETMALKVINKINGSLKFLYRKNRYLTPYLKGLLRNGLIQPHFDYACSAWYQNLNKKIEKQTANCPKQMY